MCVEPGPVRGKTPGRDDVGEGNDSLRRLAEALGGTVASLFGEAATPSDLAGLRELLGLWSGLASDASRADALRAVRAIAKAEAP